ncbi:MAG: hypothetical protein HZC36_11055 [Armatimonadetes bacterium]|nr:hypothetical protein [Armatimonadota bacterium]
MDPFRLEALSLSEGLEPTAKNIERVASQTEPSAASWAFTQWDLRRRGQAKFPKSNQMLFDRDGLEMASSSQLGSLHSKFFPEGAFAADLTCGIGGDLLALAARGPALGYESDPERAEMARWNLEVHGLSAEVRAEDCLSASWDFEYAFADPARRLGGKRTLDTSSFQPPLSELVKRLRGLEVSVVKLSPMLSDSLLDGLDAPRAFVSLGRECREVLAALGRSQALDPWQIGAGIWAVHAETGERIPGGQTLREAVGEPLGCLLEADPAAIRANALGSLCESAGAIPLGSSNGYLTTDDPSASVCLGAWVRAYRVLSHGRADEKAIQTDLHRLDAHVSDVKLRGLRADPLDWKRRLRAPGARPIILVLFPVEHSVRYTLAEPIQHPGNST